MVLDDHHKYCYGHLQLLNNNLKVLLIGTATNIFFLRGVYQIIENLVMVSRIKNTISCSYTVA